MKSIRRSNERGYTDIGWLKSHHSFSFGNYFDRSNMGFGALRAINDDVIAPGAGFGSHGHDHMEIITMVFDGAVQHMDSMGVSTMIREGEVQVMSAATGVIHSEHNASVTAPLRLLQIWIEPDMHYSHPSYDQRHIGWDRIKNIWVPIVSSFGHDGLTIRQRAAISLVNLDLGREIEYSVFDKRNGVYIFILDGDVWCDGELLKTRDALALADISPIHLSANAPARILCIEVPV